MFHASGDWICFVDADDELKCNHLQLFVDAIESNVDIIEGGFLQIDINGKESKRLYKAETIVTKDVRGTSLYVMASDKIGNAPWHTLFRKDFLRSNNICFDTRFTMNEDRIFKHTAFMFASQIRFIPLTGYVYHASSGSAMSRWHQNIEESWNVFLDIKDEIKRRSGIAPDKIQSDRSSLTCCLVWQYLWNMFKPGCPLSITQKYKYVVKCMKNEEFWHSCSVHDWSKDNVYLRLFHACISAHSPLLVVLLFYCQHKVKKVLNTINKFLLFK